MYIQSDTTIMSSIGYIHRQRVFFQLLIIFLNSFFTVSS